MSGRSGKIEASTADFEAITADFIEVVAGRYEILGFVGSGGMGAVYRARDRELDEIVALKVLRHELSLDPQALARFRREVKLARRVTHRNIARTFDIGDHNGLAFLTMELVQGESLAARLVRKKGPMSIERAVEIALEVTRGLVVAHQAGVVHRDLKPDNILLARDGRVVITDFGIAFAEEATASGGAEGAQDRPRRIVGTPAYMAPEQLETPEKIDARVDIYAVGLLFYEMLTGALPWTGKTELSTALARLMHPPRDPRELVPQLSPAIVSILNSALAKKVDERIPTAEVLATRLASIVIPTSPTLIDESGSYPSVAPPILAGAAHRTIAVLRLRRAGGGAAAESIAAEDDYVAMGIGEALIDALASLSMRVRACPADQQNRGPQEVGRELGVDAVLSGSVEPLDGSSSELRVALRLVGAHDGFVLWAGRFTGSRGGALTIATSAARSVAEALSAARLPTTTPNDQLAHPEAVDFYLRGRAVYHRFWRTAEAITLFERALAKAPDDPRILAALALALSRETGADLNTVAAREAARARAELALTLAPSLAEAHVALAVSRLRDGDASAAAELIRRGLDLAPGHVDALEHAARILLETRAIEEGIAHAELAMRVEPLLRLVLRFEVVRAYALLGEWDRVAVAFAEYPESEGSIVSYWLMRIRLAIWRDDPTDKRAVLAALEAASFSNKTFPLAFASYLRDEPPGLIEQQMLEDRWKSTTMSSRQRSFFGQLRSELLARRGNQGEALVALENSVRDGLFDEAWLDRCPALDSLRADPRFVRASEEVHARGAIITTTLLRRR